MMTYQITKGKKKIQYNVDKIIRKYRVNELQRNNLILQIIGLNPKIPHTHLIQMLLHYGKSNAKRTYEKLLNKLEKEGIITSEKIGSSTNAPRLWEIANDDTLYEKQFKEKMFPSFAMRKKQLDKVKQSLTILSDYHKALMLCTLIKSNNEKFMNVKFAKNHNDFIKQYKQNTEHERMFVDMSKHYEHLTEYENLLYELMFQYPQCIKFIPYILDSFQNMTQEMLLNIAEEFPTSKPKS